MSTPAKTRDCTSPALDHPVVNYRVIDGIAIIEMDDPPANTYTYAMNRQLDEAILKARFDDDVHVIILRGKGDRFFSAGANIGMLNAVSPGFKYFFCLHANEMLLRLEHTPKLRSAAIAISRPPARSAFRKSPSACCPARAGRRASRR
jgi:enoyl-CoA hydratase